MSTRFVGIDLAKNVFQVHAVDETGQPVIRKAVSRAKLLGFARQLERCVIGMEACASAHFWAKAPGRAGPRGAAAAAGVRQTLRQDRQARCGRRRGDPRGGAASDHALCARQDARTARRAAVASSSVRIREGSHGVCQSDPGHTGRVRAGPARGHPACGASDSSAH